MENNYAGFWLRAVALLIDSIIIYVVEIFTVIPVLGLLGFSFVSEAQSGNLTPEESIGMMAAFMGAAALTVFVFYAMIITYFSLMEASKYQGTIGKIALGLKVTDMNGEKLTFGRALGRNLSKIISSMTFTIGYIMAGITEKKQGLHDIIASTLVLKKN